MKPKFLNLLVGWLAAIAALCSCDADRGPRVVVYTSLDQHYSQPILEAFEAETGIRVLARYDTEADKTTGLFHRLVEERQRPRADVFWNSEVLRTVLLARAGVLEPHGVEAAEGIPTRFHGEDGTWVGFAARYRVLIYNTALVDASEAPRSIADLAAPRFRGRAGIALPLAGTTQTHVGALWARLGEARTESFLRALVANEVRAVDGNAVVRDLVARGELAVGLTDTDDASEGLRRGDPIRMVFPDQEPPSESGPLGFLRQPLGVFLIPNTVARIRGGPNPAAARELLSYLLSRRVESRLAESGSVQIPLRPGVETPEGIPPPDTLQLMEVRYEDAASGVTASEALVRELFLR